MDNGDGDIVLLDDRGRFSLDVLEQLLQPDYGAVADNLVFVSHGVFVLALRAYG